MIESLFQDSKDRLWVTTRRGVAVLENDVWMAVSSVPGDVFSFAEDSAGDVWMGHDDALYRVRGRKVVGRISWSSLGQTGYARLAADPSGGGLWLAFRNAIRYFKRRQADGFLSCCERYCAHAGRRDSEG
jgi:ligand-binding sensor domain-containing protein